MTHPGIQPANPKARAWDLLGADFWSKGRRTARPTQQEIQLFLAGMPAQAACAVIGASTKDLIEALLEAGLSVSVFDFSARMCEELRRILAGSGCRIEQLDVTAEVPNRLREGQDFVMSDRLLNRFTEEEARWGLAGMLQLLRDGGELRLSVKLGLYPMDERMLELGRRRGRLAEFFDVKTRTIDFTAAGEILDQAVLPHGEIDLGRLLAWYRFRQREKRFDHREVVELIGSTRAWGRRLCLLGSAEMPDAPETVYYSARSEPDRLGS